MKIQISSVKINLYVNNYSNHQTIIFLDTTINYQFVMLQTFVLVLTRRKSEGSTKILFTILIINHALFLKYIKTRLIICLKISQL